MKPINRILNKQGISLLILWSMSLAFFSCGDAEVSAENKLQALLKEKEKIESEINVLEAKLPRDTTAIAQKSIAVQLIKPTPFQHFLSVQGLVEADDNIRVSPRQPGIVSAVYVSEGAKVAKGQLLAKLEDDAFRQGMEELEGNLNFARTIYEKQKALWDKNIGTEVQYLQAKNTLQSLEDKKRTLEKTHDLYNIYAPISGSVEAVMCKVGEGVMVGMPAFVVVNTGKMTVRVNVSENHISKLKKGQTAEVFFPDLGKSFPSKIELVGNIINFTSRSFPVEVSLPPSADLKPNMLAEVRIQDYVNNAALLVPVNAIQSMEGTDFAYLATPQNGVHYARKTIVKTGMQSEGKVELLSGVKEGELIIVTGQQDIKDGQAVKF